MKLPAANFNKADFEGLDYKIVAEGKRKIEIKVAKQSGHELEDEIWEFFDALESDMMSAGHVHFKRGRLYVRHNPKISGANGSSKEFDLIVGLGDKTFFIDAKDEKNYDKVQAHLSELAKWKKDIAKATKEITPSNRPVTVLWYGLPKLPSDEIEEQARKQGVLLLCRAHLRYYSKMADEKRIARYSFLRDLFRGEEWHPIPREYPVIRVRPPESREFFVGVGTPLELMQLGRVDRRSPVKEKSYQRLLMEL